MAIEDYFDPYSYDDEETIYSKECNKCGKSNLRWEELNGKWILVTKKGEIHKCKTLDLESELNKEIKK